MKPPAFFVSIIAAWLGLCASAPMARCADPTAVTVTPDVAYKDGANLSAYETQRCRLDLYVPAGAKDVPCLLFFHGGGLTGGTKSDHGTQEICRALASEGILVASADYRLSPVVKYPAYLQDAAAAVAWMRRHVAEHGGNPARLFVAGHSAGGYLVSMLALDDRWLPTVGVKRMDLAGFIPISGQAMTHFTVREERGQPKDALTADEAAPINHVRADTPPWLILCADHDMAMRAPEDHFLADALLEIKHRDVTLREITGRTHVSIAESIAHPGDPARAAIVAFIQHPAN